ncbi:MAG TPA: hypothetical protein VNX66_11960 [Candidatus Sulfotelmatobacter sp.]|jgi:hypothetical protein|nr:hypothetical protein [Candidatus Sulfotelmatobacter sp.]
MKPFRTKRPAIVIAALLLSVSMASAAMPQSPPKAKNVWKPVPFAIVHFNEDAPKSWNLYFSSKRGVLLLRLWKRYLLIDRNTQQVFDIDPDKIVAKGDDVEFSAEDNAGQPADISDWRERDVGYLRRLRFRFGEKGSYLDIQTPLKANGTPLY